MCVYIQFVKKSGFFKAINLRGSKVSACEGLKGGNVIILQF